MAFIKLPEGTAPSTPATGTVVAYAKDDGFLYSKDDAGTETMLGGTGTALSLAGGNMAGGINSARGNITQHATTMDFFAVTSPDILDGTGSAVTITACVNAPQAGATRKFYPIVATVLTHGATFDIAGNANLTAAAGDCWIIEAKTVSTYRVTAVKEDGTAVVGGSSAFAAGIGIGGATPGTGGVAFPATQVAVADPNTLDDYEEGTFTATLTGVSGTVTGTMRYVKVGGMVTMTLDTVRWLDGTSTGSTKTFTGMPATLYPSQTRYFTGLSIDNGGSWASCLGSVSPAGVIAFFKDVSGNAFTGSGAAYCAPNTITYPV